MKVSREIKLIHALMFSSFIFKSPKSSMKAMKLNAELRNVSDVFKSRRSWVKHSVSAALILTGEMDT